MATGACYIGEAHFRFERGLVAPGAFRNIGANGARRLGHLIVEAVAGVNLVVYVLIAEALCGKLYDICKHP